MAARTPPKNVAPLIAAAVRHLQKTAETNTSEEQTELFCGMMRAIRTDFAACQAAAADPVAYLGKYINEEAKRADALHLCALVKKLRAVDTSDRSTMLAFYSGMIEHAQARARLSAGLPAEGGPPVDIVGSPYMARRMRDGESKLRLLRILTEEVRARVSASAADDLKEYADFVEATVDLIADLSRTR
jgi:hypothetical protein